MTQRESPRCGGIPADRIVFVPRLVEIDVGARLVASVGERQQSAQRRRASVVSRQGCHLQEVHAPAGFGDRLASPIVVRSFDVSVAGNPEVNRTAPVLLMELATIIQSGL